jgi:hypothetical protein
VSLTAFTLLLNGCSVSDKTLANAEKRIDALKSKGVPDSSLSSAKVSLYQARDSKRRGEKSIAHKAAKTMQVLIAQAEEKYDADMQRLKPTLDQAKQKFSDARTQLDGLPARRLDSVVAKIDSFMTINYMLEAEALANSLDTTLPHLKFDMERGQEIRGRVLGRWTCSIPIKHSTDKTVNGVEEKVFTFNNDGTGSLVERKKGKTTPLLKEDWEFRSEGAFDIMGDTVFLSVNRFKSVKQNFIEKHMKDGKESWETKSYPTYDSTITDHSQDRYITFETLQEDFKHN